MTVACILQHLLSVSRAELLAGGERGGINMARRRALGTSSGCKCNCITSLSPLDCCYCGTSIRGVPYSLTVNITSTSGSAGYASINNGCVGNIGPDCNVGGSFSYFSPC